MLVGAARPFGASRARRSAWFAWPARASTLTIRAPVLARPLDAARGPGLLVPGGRAPVCCAMAASPLRCGGSPHTAVAVVREMLGIAHCALRRLGLFGFLAHEALRKRSASGSAGNFGIQVRRSGLAGLAAPAGGTHGVLTESSQRAHGVANGVSRKGCSRGTRRGATHGAAVLGRTNGSRCSGCGRTSVPSAVRVAPSTHVALKYPHYCGPCCPLRTHPTESDEHSRAGGPTDSDGTTQGTQRTDGAKGTKGTDVT